MTKETRSLLSLTLFPLALLGASGPSCQGHVPARPVVELCNPGPKQFHCNDPRLPEGSQNYRIPLGDPSTFTMACHGGESYRALEEWAEELIQIIVNKENCGGD